MATCRFETDLLRGLLVGVLALSSCAFAAAQTIDAYAGYGHGEFLSGKGTYGRQSARRTLSSIDVNHAGLRYADSMSAAFSMRFMLGVEQWRLHESSVAWLNRSDVELRVLYLQMGWEPAWRPIRSARRMVLSAPVFLSFRTSARATGTTWSYYPVDTSYSLNNERSYFGGFNISPQLALAYEVPLSPTMGLALGGFASFGLFDQDGPPIWNSQYLFGFRAALYHNRLARQLLRQRSTASD